MNLRARDVDEGPEPLPVVVVTSPRITSVGREVGQRLISLGPCHSSLPNSRGRREPAQTGRKTRRGDTGGEKLRKKTKKKKNKKKGVGGGVRRRWWRRDARERGKLEEIGKFRDSALM